MEQFTVQPDDYVSLIVRAIIAGSLVGVIAFWLTKRHIGYINAFLVAFACAAIIGASDYFLIAASL